MKCKNCQRFKEIENTSSTQQGLCTYPDSWMPVQTEDECHFQVSGEIKCQDCDRFNNDMACMTCEKDESAVAYGLLCPGFIDKHMIAVRAAIAAWKARGWDYKVLVEQQIQAVENEPQAFLPKNGLTKQQ